MDKALMMGATQPESEQKTWRNTVRATTLVMLVSISVLFAITNETRSSKNDLIAGGRASTAFVLAGKDSVSTAACCINADGWFVTTADAVGQSSTVDLVVAPGTQGEAVHKASVVRTDPKLGLAMLRIKSNGEFRALSFASDDALKTLKQVIAFGAPPGWKPKSPVAVAECGITKVYSNDGEVWHLRIDAKGAQLVSGGPVIDTRGDMVGMYVANEKKGYAIPANLIRHFVTTPQVTLEAPALTEPQLLQEVGFDLKVGYAQVPARPYDAKLILAVNGTERVFEMQRAKHGFQVKTVPMPKGRNSPLVDIHAQFTFGSIRGVVADREFAVGANITSLSKVQRVQPSEVHLRDGGVFRGPIRGLSPLEVYVGGQKLSVDLANANSVEVHVSDDRAVVECTAVLYLDGKVVTQAKKVLYNAGPPPHYEPKTVRLQSTITQVAVGGSGRFLVMHSPKSESLYVFDVAEAKVVKEIPIKGECLTAAGEKSFVAIRWTKVEGKQEWNVDVQRWIFSDLNRDERTSFTMKVPPRSACMGHSSAGPMAISGVDWPRLGETVFFDVATMKRIEGIVPPHDGFHTNPDVFLRASADGRVFACQMNKGAGTQIIELVDSKAKRRDGQIGDLPMPGVDGKNIFTTRGVYSSKLVREREEKSCWPAIVGRYYLTCGDTADKNADVVVHDLDTNREIAKFKSVVDTQGIDLNARRGLTLDQRFVLLPKAKVLAVIPKSCDKIVLYNFDPGSSK